MAGNTPPEVAEEIAARIAGLDRPGVEPVRRIRREFSRRLRDRPPAELVELAVALRDRYRWVGCELLYHHPGGFAALDGPAVERLGQGLASWGDVDAFARYVSGMAWQHGRVSDELIRSWAASPDRWWRRAALVSTVPLNLRTAGGTGDPDRTLDICLRLVSDRDDMVVKALSWALRELVVWDPGAVRAFLADHDGTIAARVRREVTAKLETGLKNPR